MMEGSALAHVTILGFEYDGPSSKEALNMPYKPPPRSAHDTALIAEVRDYQKRPEIMKLRAEVLMEKK